MVDQIRVVSFMSPGSVGDVDVTDPGITEAFSAALFFYQGATADDTDEDHGLIGLGCCVANGQEVAYATAGENDAGIATPNYNTARDAADASGGCIAMVTGPNPAVVLMNADFVSAQPGGVRINFTVVPPTPVKIFAVLLAGLTDAGAGFTSGSGSTHEQTGLSPFFMPDVLVFFGGGGTFNTLGLDAQARLGFAIRSPANELSSFISIADGTEPTDADGEVSSDACFCGHTSTAGRTTLYADISSFNSDGFTWAPRVASTHGSMYLALKFSGNVRIACANMALPASTGVSAFNAFGFTPDLVIGLSTLMTAEDTPTDGVLAGAVGLMLTGRHGSRAVTMHGEVGKSGTGPFNTENRAEDVALLTYEHTGTTVAQRATWAGGSGSGGFLLDFSVATAGYLTALGIQLVPNPPLPIRRPQQQRRTPWQRVRRLGLVHGRGPGSPPLTANFWKAILRMRRKLADRLRWRPRPIFGPMEVQVGVELEEHSIGRVSAPGALRGRVVGSETLAGRASGAMVTRGRLAGPGVDSPDEIDP